LWTNEQRLGIVCIAIVQYDVLMQKIKFSYFGFKSDDFSEIVFHAKDSPVHKSISFGKKQS
jgi:hypothetical protein